MGLVAYNKRFLNADVGGIVSAHDARLLRESTVYRQILNGGGIPQRTLALGDYGEIPLTTIGNDAFPKFSWLIKCYNDDTRDAQQKYFNKKLRGARVVTEHAYGMLKGRWRILYKKTECRMRNVKYIITACILLHNLCIELSDPCQPRWRFEVGEFSLMPKQTGRIEDTAASELNRLKISNWLWSH